MKKSIISIIVLMSITACSTNPNAMRGNAPDVVHTSEKNPKEIAICIAQQWENHSVVNQREIKNGYSLTSSLNGNLHHLVDIEKTGNITKSKVYNYKFISLGENPYFSAVAECQS